MLSPPSSSQLLYSTRPPFMLKLTLPYTPTVPSSCPVWLLTPGTRVASWVKLRPFNCNCVISLPVTVPARSEDWVSGSHGRALHRNLGSGGAYLQRRVLAKLLADPKGDVLSLELLEAGCIHGHAVGSSGQTADKPIASGVSNRWALNALRSIAYRDFGVSNGGS